MLEKITTLVDLITGKKAQEVEPNELAVMRDFVESEDYEIFRDYLAKQILIAYESSEGGDTDYMKAKIMLGRLLKDIIADLDSLKAQPISLDKEDGDPYQ